MKNDVTTDITFAYNMMLGYHPNKLTLVVTGHFLVEHLLDKIIYKKCRNAKKIIEYPFSTKLEFLYSMDLLPDEIYKNIKILNKIRNEIVHTLNITIKEEHFFKLFGEKITLKKPKSRDPEKHYLKLLAFGNLVLLRNHMLLNLKISPHYNFF